MGIKHLRKVRAYMKDNPDTFFLRGHLRKKCNLEAKTLEECLDYLVNEEKSITRKEDKRVRYKWQTKKK